MPPVRIKKYLCHEDGCDKAYNRPCLLRQHQLTHSNERPFTCPRDGCEGAFFRKSHLDVHLLSHLPDEEKPYKCLICNKGFTSPQRLGRHEATHAETFRCSYAGCDRAFYTWQSRKHHEDMAHEKLLQCLHCNKNFQTLPKLNKHKLKEHGETSLFPCDQPGCFSTYDTQKALNLHIKKAHPKIKCPHCEKECMGKNMLDAHLVCHESQDQLPLWKCRSCHILVEFGSKQELEKHHEEVHEDKNSSSAFDESQIDTSLLKDSRSLQTMLREKDTNPEAVKRLLEGINPEDIAENGHAPRKKRRRRKREDETIALPEGKSIIRMVANLNQITYSCPRPKCERTFVRVHAFKKHIKQHKLDVARACEILERLEAEEKSLVKSEPKDSEVAPFALNDADFSDDLADLDDDDYMTSNTS